ncbi:unnamed protein product [Symbiodinium natans]|uniref:Uncharacterized protein n=1 Tax=Symbiodinium natans TaxID=878477 RepID=A0A812LST1_9DINO|nr:unnamed protein product [Symbiodinium natans]
MTPPTCAERSFPSVPQWQEESLEASEDMDEDVDDEVWDLPCPGTHGRRRRGFCNTGNGHRKEELLGKYEMVKFGKEFSIVDLGEAIVAAAADIMGGGGSFTLALIEMWIDEILVKFGTSISMDDVKWLVKHIGSPKTLAGVYIKLDFLTLKHWAGCTKEICAKTKGPNSHLLYLAVGKKQPGGEIVVDPFKRGFVLHQGDLVCINKGPTGTGQTEVHVLDAASDLKNFKLHVATPWGYTSKEQSGQEWWFGIKSNGDLLGLLLGPHTGTGKSEVHVLSAASDYQDVVLHAETPLDQVPRSQWNFGIDGWDHLYCITRYDFNPKVFRAPVHANYGKWDIQQAMNLRTSPNHLWEMVVASNGDVVALYLPGPSDFMREWRFSKMSNYQSHDGSKLSGAKWSQTYQQIRFTMRRNDDILGVVMQGTGHKKTEAISWTAGSGYKTTGWFQPQSGLHEVSPSQWDFAML